MLGRNMCRCLFPRGSTGRGAGFSKCPCGGNHLDFGGYPTRLHVGHDLPQKVLSLEGHGSCLNYYYDPGLRGVSPCQHVGNGPPGRGRDIARFLCTGCKRQSPGLKTRFFFFFLPDSEMQGCAESSMSKITNQKWTGGLEGGDSRHLHVGTGSPAQGVLFSGTISRKHHFPFPKPHPLVEVPK